ncbi:MAG: glucose-6-phosphate dehydrogenase [Planctomycetota bacterium]|nr:glucose-6-phosphate dehydrogenase [Planctomycetota bacterium]MDA1137762.1 glucose-6-phosphate dehydrogenase [Planctomycetota bacterium]
MPETTRTKTNLHALDIRSPHDCGVVIFGASGDLTKRKLLPAFYNLFVDGILPKHFIIIGFARSEMTNEVFQELARQAINEFSRRPIDQGKWNEFASRLYYHRGHYDEPDSFHSLQKLQSERHNNFRSGKNWLYYLATPPSAYGDIGACLKQTGLAEDHDAGEHWSRLVVEKPIGRDLDSATKLNRSLAASFDESQTYRIDHYLGKETVQNILVMRFANGIFEPLWNHNHIDHVQITVSETGGLDRRGGYYEDIGALRDMVQNHLLQLLCLTAMEPPHNLGADAIRDEKRQILEALRPISSEQTNQYAVRGQYGEGLVKGSAVIGYRAAEKVAEESQTETFVALKCYIDNWRWSGVPFYLRTGKRLPKQCAEISIFFRGVPPILFNANPSKPVAPNVLSIRIQPNEGIALEIGSKVPGPHVAVRPVSLDFGYSSVYPAGTPEAYERLLLDVMLGDATLFMRRDEVEAAWSFITPILDGWSKQPINDFPNYMAGSWGPATADELLFRDGRRWRRL